MQSRSTYVGGIIDLPELVNIAIRREAVDDGVFLASISAVLVDDPCA
jgi:hypothetical protein